MSLTLYLKEISRTPLLTREEEEDLTRRIAQGDLAARQKMVEANLRLVVHTAKHFRGQGMELEDLIGHGNLGLFIAAERFDLRYGVRFSTYATYWVKHCIRRGIDDEARTIRIPLYLLEVARKWEKTAHRLERLLRAAPPEDEISRSLGMSPKKIERMKEAKSIHYEKLKARDKEAELDKILAASTQDPSEFCAEREELAAMQRALWRLPPRDRQILRLRYGLNGRGWHTLQQIGNELGITRERTRQLHDKALEKLREELLPS